MHFSSISGLVEVKLNLMSNQRKEEKKEEEKKEEVVLSV